MTEGGRPTGANGASPVKAVFFDAGFTLIYPTRPIVDIYLEAARAVSASHCDTKLKEAFHRAWAEGTRDERDDHRSSDQLERARWQRFTYRIAERIPELFPHHASWLEQLTNTFDSGRGWRLDPEAPLLLRGLRDRGLTVGIVSNWHGGLHRILTEVGLVDMVDFVVCSADVGYRKPHPEIFHEALRKCGTPPSAVVHVGDTWAEDVVGARAVGILAVHLTSGGPNGTDHRDGSGHHSITSLADLSSVL
jgi:putative hydrolase of the HAD superfamily